jgi:hypothetical protein
MRRRFNSDEEEDGKRKRKRKRKRKSKRKRGRELKCKIRSCLLGIPTTSYSVVFFSHPPIREVRARQPVVEGRTSKGERRGR